MVVVIEMNKNEQHNNLRMIGCTATTSRTIRIEVDSYCARCIHRGDGLACQSYRIENDLKRLWVER